jgi:hypothetical protein
MGLFSFFNRKNGNGVPDNSNLGNKSLPDIPEPIFIEKDSHKEERTEDKNGSSLDVGINALFQFLEKNYQSQGYDDALVNPDTTHLQQNIDALKNDFGRTIVKVKTFYQDFIREANFHIVSRSRSGLIETVEELTVKKETAEQHIRQVLEIEELAKNNDGPGQSIVISYTRGFKNGLAAISHHSILRKNF